MKTLLSNEKGQAVTEMALTLPIILLIIAGTFTFGFMIYTKTVLVLSTSQAAKLGSFIVSDTTMTEEEKKLKIENTAKSFLGSSIGGEVSDIDVIFSSTDVSVKVKYKFNFILPLLADILNEDEYELEYTTKCIIQ